MYATGAKVDNGGTFREMMYTPTIQYVLDTSVIIKWYRQDEVLAEEAMFLRDAYLKGKIAISFPALLAYELANVLRYKHELSVAQVQDAMQSLFELSVDWHSPTSVLMQRAVEIAHNFETTVYDAAFVALAEALNIDFITADKRLTNRLSSLPFVRFLGQIESPATT
ncbi:MAG: type II toxin-antitoxin system VapC family toxin [Chloroflexi bacterium]|nr:type II toxin-antitoxin system VapC family toxin [Chloroflexota bacterium]MBU1659850.1 type II toxin-antitoxin system VapC family toxin [Chloroflexota bacterium]